MQWCTMDSAPKDGKLLRLLVNFTEHSTEDTAEPAATIGFWNEEEWQFAGWCWSHDHFTQGEGTVVGWLPIVEEGNDGIPTIDLDQVIIPREWFFKARKFIAWFTSGNSIPRDIKPLVKNDGGNFSEEATALRELIKDWPNVSQRTVTICRNKRTT